MRANRQGGLGLLAGVLVALLILLAGLIWLNGRQGQIAVHEAPVPPEVNRLDVASSSVEEALTNATPTPSRTARLLTTPEVSNSLEETEKGSAIPSPIPEPARLTVQVLTEAGEPAPFARVWVLREESYREQGEQILPAEMPGGLDPFSGSSEVRHLASDGNGEVVLPITQPSGQYIVSAIGSHGGAGRSDSFPIQSPPTEATIRVVLEAPAALRGFVLTSDGNPVPVEPTPSPRLQVVLQPTILFEAGVFVAGVEEDGSYAHQSLPPIDYLARIDGEVPDDWARPAERLIQRSRLLMEAAAEENFILTRASALLGLVEDSFGNPLGRARVTWQALPEEGGALIRGGSVITDFDGVFSFEDLPFRPIVLEVGHLSHETKTLEIGYPDQMDLVVSLEALPAVQGYVVTAEGREPVAGATIQIEPLPGSNALPRTGGSLKTNAVGWFSFQASGSGGVVIRATKQDAGLEGQLRVENIEDFQGGDRELTLEVGAAETLWLQLTLDEPEMRMPRSVTYTLLENGKPSRIGIAQLNDGGATLLVGALRADRIQVSVTGGKMFGESPIKLPGQRSVAVAMRQVAGATQ